MRRYSILAALLATTGALSAQTTDAIAAPSHLRTVTRAGVFAGMEVSSLPADTHILRPVELTAETLGARARLTIAPLREPLVMGASFGWSGGARSLSDAASNSDVLARAGTTGNGSPGLSPQTYCLVLWPIDSRTGTLVIEFKGIRVNRSLATAAVAIGDRKVEFEASSDGTGKRIVVGDLRPGADGLPVKITLAGLATGAAGPGSFEAALALRFTGDGPPPQECRVAPDQRGCPQGGVLSGRFLSVASTDVARHHLVLGLEGALPDAVGVTLLSRKGDLARFPFTDCPILLDPVVFGLFRTDMNGNARSAIPIPRVPWDLQFFIQQVTVKFGGDRGLHIASSNTLQVRCSH